MKTIKFIPPGSTIGIFGNGQLGQMFGHAAKKLDYSVVFFHDVPGCADSVGSFQSIIASYEDTNSLERFARMCDIFTLEFENIPAAVYDTLARLGKTICPNRECLITSQDRRKEKALARSLGIPTPEYWIIDLEKLCGQNFEFPAILKTTTGGYDGKGQKRVKDLAELKSAWESFSKQPCILEKVVGFFFEFSIILARNARGNVAVYEPFQNTHRDGILRETVWPPPPLVPGGINLEKAKDHAQKIADKLNLVGLLAVEFFCTVEGEIIFNEIAPRPHNSGHITIDCATTSQFEQHVRAICGLPFGSTQPTCNGTMVNVIGDHSAFDAVRNNPKVVIHDYGKQARNGRKLGHYTCLHDLAG